MKDWQAAIAGFAILFLIGETSAAPLAVAIAWGIPLLYFTRNGLKGASLAQT